MKEKPPWPLVAGLAAAICVVLLFVAGAFTNETFFGLGSSLMFIAVIAIPVLLAAILPQLRRVLRQNRNDRRLAAGRYTPYEQACLHAWEDGRRVRATLLTGTTPSRIVPAGVVVEDQEECFFFDHPLHYCRYFGTSVVYAEQSGFYAGSPGFVAAMTAAELVGNAMARNAAVRGAAEQWREHQIVRVLVSDRRLYCQVGMRWLSFWYSSVDAVYPEVSAWTLVLQFPESEPLMLHGPAVAVIAPIVTHYTLGRDALGSHPSLRVVDFVGMGRQFPVPLPPST